MRASLRKRTIIYGKPANFEIEGPWQGRCDIIPKTILTDFSSSLVLTNFIPDGALVIGAGFFAVTDIVSAGDRTTFTASDGAANIFSVALTSQKLVKGSSVDMKSTAYTVPKQFNADATITFASSGGTTGVLNAGKLRVQVWYINIVAPKA